MKEQAVARVYAKSLLELGDDNKVNIADELTKLTEVINKSNELENVLFLELFTLEEKKTVFVEVAKKLSLSAITTETVKFLIDEKRIGILPLIIKEVIVMDDDRRGFMKGTIEGSDAQIDPAFKAKIESFLKNKLGREPSLNYVQNSNLSAGYKVTVEDLQLDASLDNQLEQFKQSILSE
ncbi:F0F1 ATP synthase subunit delta [Peredibacter starrii]|uniref:ATP synthase subunit delta n=1 Tax=Peredibacter starrii TaxID=28202 RepID=A0AAX4HQJ1_9BACT|nr:F0F1 ATP synthase subunit delta [Peredibacter starrii]WPU65388.1 F0F1 ATP synthase subunit delta [Peredibacter starrii]